MGADKIFVLILSLAFAAFIGYLIWSGRKNQSAGSPASQAGPPSGEPAPDEPAAAEEARPEKKGKARSRRR
jgi:hypothetical protein